MWVRGWAAALLLFGCAGKPSQPGKAVTYQVVEPLCTRCDLEQLVAERVSREAMDCGTAERPEDNGRVLACIAQAQSSGRAFQATVAWKSTEHVLRSVFLGNADGNAIELYYDSGLGKGTLACSAAVSEKMCSKIAAEPGSGRPVCTGTAPTQELCDEGTRRRRELTPERPIGELECTGQLERHEGETVPRVSCRRGTGGTPAALEQSVVCSVLKRDPNELICFERSGWEADAFLRGDTR